jgi:pantothenate kinase
MTVTRADDLAARVRDAAGDKPRFMIGIAGPPGSGKSTLAEQLAERLREAGDTATVVPMDGFHYDDAVLDRLGLRSRKGSPPTFDCAGFEVLLKRLKAREADVAIPVFDRSMELARAGAEIIGDATRFLVIEGNYLLLRDKPWSRLKPLFDLTVFLDVPVEELDRRLVARWDFYGRPRDEARRWIDGNDLPNVRAVIGGSVAADIVISQ